MTSLRLDSPGRESCDGGRRRVGVVSKRLCFTMKAVPLSLFVLFIGCHGDLYLHSPRGSNNRLKEQSANRQNANRVFDSQNNNRGGYNVGDATAQAANNDVNKQYNMKYFQSGPWKTLQGDQGKSYLVVEWTNQHGCGGNEDTDPHKQNCNLVLQYMCQDEPNTPNIDSIRNGVNPATQQHNRIQNLKENKGTSKNRKNNAIKQDRALHESWEWYDSCYNRERNKGLFTADQKLKKNNGNGYSSAIYTRQNPNGNRRGYECPEERDYYPYWHPTPWKDIAVLAQNSSMCSYYTKNSFNVQAYGECVETYGDGSRKHWSRWNNAAECKDNGGTWRTFANYLEKAPELTSEAACKNSRKGGVRRIWAVPYDAADPTKAECLVALDPPDCKEAPWSRSNHLGNGRFGAANNYTWILPYFPSEKTKRCAFRMRYNISTDDYDPYFTDASYNEDVVKMKMSPVQQNPYVEIGAGRSPLRLAINTAQFGRVFQDRSHMFKLKKREAGFSDKTIHNVNVRGKRGNIVQVYPAVEYDFFPTHLNIKEGELVHFQWTGSNTHNNGNPAGDGQAGSAGQGKAGTDRNNMVQINSANQNYPSPYENTSMWDNAKIVWIYHGKDYSNKNLAVNMASSGYYRCIKTATCGGESVQSKGKLNKLLDNAPASYEGVVLQFTKGTYHYMCTRNNNFTNRSQKASITVR